MIGALKSKGGYVLLSGLALALAGGAAMLRGDISLTGGFDRALEAPRPGLSFDSAAARERAQANRAGDEGYWLTRAEVESPAPFAKSLAVGDRITIAGQDGRERQLEVVTLKSIGGNLVRAGTEQVRLLLVTCRVVDGAAEAPVRFIIEATPAAPAAPAPAKAL